MAVAELHSDHREESPPMTAPTSTTRYYIFDPMRCKYLAAGPDGCVGFPAAAAWDEWTRERRNAVSYSIQSHAFCAFLRRRDRYPALAILPVTTKSRTPRHAREEDHDVTATSAR